MTQQTVTVQVRLIKFGDQWNGPNGPEAVTGIVNNYDPSKFDLTLANPALGTSRTVTLNKDQWFAVTRNV